MRNVFGVLSLLLVILVIGFLAKKQLETLSSMGAMPAASAGISVQSTMLPQQSQELQNQVKKSVEESIQQARPQADEN